MRSPAVRVQWHGGGQMIKGDGADMAVRWHVYISVGKAIDTVLVKVWRMQQTNIQHQKRLHRPHSDEPAWSGYYSWLSTTKSPIKVLKPGKASLKWMPAIKVWEVWSTGVEEPEVASKWKKRGTQRPSQIQKVRGIYFIAYRGYEKSSGNFFGRYYF